jgi:hypothetical protein
MSTNWYLDGSVYVCVRSGMPEQHVEIGCGDSYREAVANLESTAIQSVGRDGGVASALAWAHGAGWISDPDELEETDDPGGKETVEQWDTEATYVATFPGDPHDGACDVEVQVGQGDDGQWYLRTTDDAGGSDDASDDGYDSEDAARSAASAFASERHEAETDEDAEQYLRRQTEERADEPDDDGEWCIYWATSLEDSGPRARYATREQAEAAAEIANDDLRQAHRGHLLCGYEVRRLVADEWRRIETD